MQQTACIVQGERMLDVKDVVSAVRDPRMLPVMVNLIPLLDSSKEEVVTQVARPLRFIFPGMQAFAALVAASQQKSVLAAREKHCFDHPASTLTLPEEQPFTGSVIGIVHFRSMTC